MKKEPKKTDNDVNNIEKLQNKSIDELKGIAKLRRIKNRNKLKKEGLITSLLKSESSNVERNCMKYFNNNTNVSDITYVSINTNVSNNTNVNDNNNDDDDDTYDGKIKDKISDIRVILNRCEIL